MADMTPLVLEIKANTSQATASIRKLKHDMSGIGRSMDTSSFGKGLRSIGKDAKSAGKIISGALLAPMRNMTKGITQTVGAFQKLTNSFGRILMYRAVRSMIREIGDALKYGVNNLYAWSSGVGGQFAASMDRIATAFSYFKNSVGAAVAPLINALAPAIDFVIDKAVTLLNVINQLFARLTGQTYWTRATKQAAAYGGAVSAAGGAAKEAMRYLAPFDELNVLPDNSSGGGGGGSGGSGAGGLFEDVVEFDESVSNFAGQLRDAFLAGDWETLGKTIGDKVNELVNDEYIGNVKWSDLGAKFGKGVNGILSTTYWTLETVNFTNIGSGVATGLNSALAEIDAEIAGRLAARKITATLDLAIGFLTDLDWGQLATKISDGIKGFMNELTDWLNSKDWETLGRQFSQNIADFFGNVDLEGIINSFFKTFGSLISAGANFVVGIYDEMKAGTFGTFWQEFANNVAQLRNDFVEIVATLTGNHGAFIKNGVNDALDSAESQLSQAEQTEGNVQNTVREVLDIGSDTKDRETPTGMSAGTAQASGENPVNILDLLNLGETTNNGLPITLVPTGITYPSDWKTPEINSTADLAQTIQTKLEKKKPKITSEASFASWDYKSGIWKRPGLVSEATFASWDYKSGIWKRPGLISEAAFASWDYKSGIWKRPGLISKAMFAESGFASVWKTPNAYTLALLYSYLLSNGWTTPSVDTNANIVSKTVSSVLKYNGSMNINCNANIVSTTGSISLTRQYKAKGGAFFGNKWHSIPQYASGGNVHGSLFLAGEAGPEIVGHVGGRTEVLNQSQLAAAVSAGVAQAINSARFSVRGISSAPSYTQNDSGFSEETLYQAFLRALTDADISNDTYLDGQKIYESTVRYNQRNTRMTGVNALA